MSRGAHRQFGLNGATTGERADLLTDIRVAGAAGYDVVELRDVKMEQYLRSGGTLEAVRSHLREAGVAVLSLNALEDSTLRTGAALDAILHRCRTLCEWSQTLDCPYVVSVPSLLPAGGLAETEVCARTVAALRAMARVAAELGVQVGFEFLGYPTCSVNTLRAARGIVDELGDDRVGLVVDTSHFYAGGSQLEDLDGLDGARVFIVHLDDAEPGDPAHLTDAQRLLPGDGVIPLRPLLARLESASYRGVYSLELFRPEYWGWEPDVLARRGLESMQRLFA